MTTESPYEKSLTEPGAETMRQHQQIHRLAQQIGSASGLVQLLERLQEFRSAVLVHFADEEAPEGFFEVVRRRAGRHLDKIDRLQGEHQTFLDEIDALSTRAREMLAGPVAELLGVASEIARKLHDHEARENELLVDAFYVDLGEEA